MTESIIHTSERAWLARLATTYRNRQPVVLVDDAEIGVAPQHQTLLAMGRQVSLPLAAWVAVLVSLGMGTLGAWMVVAAVLDPDPTSKLWLMVGSGGALAMCGGFSAVRVLTTHKPPKVTLTKDGLRLEWD